MAKKYDSSHHDAPVRGMANMLWWLVWSDVAEFKGVSLAGKSVERVAPPTPALAFAIAERYLGMIEQHNGLSWEAIFAAAWKADHLRNLEQYKDDADFIPGRAEPKHDDYWGEFAEEFGEFLAHMVTGGGSCWFDDHAEFKLGSEILGDVREFDVPHLDSGEAFCQMESIAVASFTGKAGQKYAMA